MYCERELESAYSLRRATGKLRAHLRVRLAYKLGPPLARTVAAKRQIHPCADRIVSLIVNLLSEQGLTAASPTIGVLAVTGTEITPGFLIAPQSGDDDYIKARSLKTIKLALSQPPTCAGCRTDSNLKIRVDLLDVQDASDADTTLAVVGIFHCTACDPIVSTVNSAGRIRLHLLGLGAATLENMEGISCRCDPTAICHLCLVGKITDAGGQTEVISLERGTFRYNCFVLQKLKLRCPPDEAPPLIFCLHDADRGILAYVAGSQLDLKPSTAGGRDASNITELLRRLREIDPILKVNCGVGVEHQKMLSLAGWQKPGPPSNGGRAKGPTRKSATASKPKSARTTGGIWMR
ncbi:hypothetical protein DFJ74DRAFT_640502 [Hyaloraphidium curvatum]|nr:hypothetical protein DFJ74DRAFT_640502 [Hyaloraphidium curvatum]